MRALISFLWDAVRAVASSLGLVRTALGLTIAFLLYRFYDAAVARLAEEGVRHLPAVSGTIVAAGFLALFVLGHVLALAVRLQREAKPILAVKILDPAERYETFVAMGNRLLRLYHLEVENRSRTRSARNVSVLLESYQKAGDRRRVDIRSRLKIANSDAEELDLKPRARAVFELIGVEADGADTLGIAEPREEQTFSIVPSGCGRISLVAEGDDVAPAAERYTLYVDTNGVMTIKPQAEAADPTSG